SERSAPPRKPSPSRSSSSTSGATTCGPGDGSRSSRWRRGPAPSPPPATASASHLACPPPQRSGCISSEGSRPRPPLHRVLLRVLLRCDGDLVLLRDGEHRR